MVPPNNLPLFYVESEHGLDCQQWSAAQQVEGIDIYNDYPYCSEMWHE